MRRTGRTTRMLEEAARLDAKGRAVYVVTADEAQRRRLAAEFEQEHGVTGVKFETEASLGAAWDWKRLRIRGAHPNCVVLVDHHAIEQHFGAMLDMLHRFDLKPTPTA